MSAFDKIIRKLNFMQRPIVYLKSINPESINLQEFDVFASYIVHI
jgi:hypothetical protein